MNHYATVHGRPSLSVDRITCSLLRRGNYIAVSKAKELGCTSLQVRELALRFHRNGRVEGIVKELFRLYCRILSIPTEPLHLDREKLLNICATVCASVLKRCALTLLTLCFDEVNTLYKRHINFFLKNDFYLAELPEENAESGEDDPSVRGSTDVERGLFYAVAQLMCKLSRECST